MKVMFIADAHLRNRNTCGYQYLLEFFGSLSGIGNGAVKANIAEEVATSTGRQVIEIDDLYILGDFFDFWFAEGAFIYPEFRDIAEAVAELKERGVRVHLCEGNHDFLLSDYFARQMGMEVIRDWATITLDGRRVLISHGDTVDVGNKKYLLLRKFLRSNFFYRLQRALPISLLWRLAQLSSHLSKELTLGTADVLAQKMVSFARRKFKDDFDGVILGHCHKHMIVDSLVNGKKRTLALLGDWVNQYSYLCYDDGNFTLATYRPVRESSARMEFPERISLTQTRELDRHA